MPVADPAAKRYARAAFELAVAQGNVQAWSDALAQVGDFMSDPDVRRVLENTRVAQDAKLQLVEAALGDAGLPPLALNVARLLVRKGRTALAAEVAAQFRALAEEREGIARARAVTAVELSEAERQTLAQRLEEQTGRRILLETAVEPRLIGGVIVQIGDRLVDASTRTRLEALRRQLVEAG